MRIATYDIETYPNYFLLVAKLLDEPSFYGFEISARRCDARALAEFVATLDRMVGFNNEEFDYPLLHVLYYATIEGYVDKIGSEATALWLNNHANEIIGSQKTNTGRQSFIVWDRHRIVAQVDLRKVHHLHNRSRMTSLKALQVVMRSPSVIDLPFEPGTILTSEQMDVTAAYCCNDVGETERFFKHSKAEVDFRESLGRFALCLSDAAIGKHVMRKALEKAEPGCTQRATIRDKVAIADIILPYVRFQRETFNQVLEIFRSTEIPGAQVKQAFPTVKRHHRGITYSFGVGGLHACAWPDNKKNRLIYAQEDEEWEIRDIDVTSYYPTLAIVNKLRPEHLGETFCREYYTLFLKRREYAKGTAENGMLKLALNSVFGDSGSPTSRGFHDVAFMLSITVNGQLLTCMLAEALSEIPQLRVLQANTDGITVIYPRRDHAIVNDIKAWWEWGTGLSLEEVYFRRIWLRDVNAYLAETVAGKVKRAGPYEYDINWWQDPSMLCVPRATEAALIRGEGVDDFLARRLQEDPWDFLIRGQAKDGGTLWWNDERCQKITRYYITNGTTGGPLVKQLKPLRGKTEVRKVSFHGGRPVMLCNRFDGRPPPDVDIGWYAAEARKLIGESAHYR